MSPEQLNHYNQASLAPTLSAVLHLIGPGLLAFSLTAILMPIYINWLKKLNIDQQLREEGPKSHAHKAKTPTMGGLCFMLTTALSLALWAFLPGPKPALDASALVLGVGLLCGFIGGVDDGAKVRQRANKGISARLRLVSETVIGAMLGFVLCVLTTVTLVVAAHSSAHAFIALPVLIVIALAAFLTAATTNAVNLHDGMDGLAAGTSMQVFATLAVMLLDVGQSGYATISATAAFALCGFLLYNKNPAKIFMGDTGSLFIGGLMAALVLAGGLTIYFIPLSLIYIAEALSVMAQVTYFKLTKPYKPEKPMSLPALTYLKLTKKLPGEGKRLFAMAPLHHHFEAVLGPKGWTEWQVVAAFWLVQFGLCMATLALFYQLR